MITDKVKNRTEKPWGAYIYSFFGDLICIWWVYLFLVMMEALLYMGNSISVLSYILFLIFLGPATVIFSIIGFCLSAKSTKGKEILFVSAVMTLIFLVLPCIIYFSVSFFNGR